MVYLHLMCVQAMSDRIFVKMATALLPPPHSFPLTTHTHILYTAKHDLDGLLQGHYFI